MPRASKRQNENPRDRTYSTTWNAAAMSAE
jgi:hypothetical protein